jgi:hypothetical protein
MSNPIPPGAVRTGSRALIVFGEAWERHVMTRRAA